MPTRPTIETTVAEVCEAFNTQDTARVVAQFASAGLFKDLTGSSHVGHGALSAVFGAMFEADPTAQYHLDEQLIDPPAKALIAWRKTSQTAAGLWWWEGLDVLAFDDEGRILSKSVYAKAAAPLIRADGDGS